jgi:hypothetical protein
VQPGDLAGASRRSSTCPLATSGRPGDAGVRFAIDSDAHSTGHLGYLRYGVGKARRGWLTAEDGINTWPAAAATGVPAEGVRDRPEGPGSIKTAPWSHT